VYLKQLEVLGFKSFANKTTVKFAAGVTAIVGPNGCGKTNILDALRWVLGEQRPTRLRGGKMEEVIFNGTRDLKPLGMAEASLTVINDRNVLPTEYHEVQITRRLFRSGESEYLLNKVPCRLKDITDLFVDTGMGAHSYSVIQQDMVDAVISDKAEERRFLFEEAAGITKYKQRKNAALRKLESTDQDLLRLKDIYGEVKTRATSLYRQHKKAERYQAMADEIKSWEIFLAATRIRQSDTEKRQLQAERESLFDLKLARETSLNSLSAQLEATRTQLLDNEQKLNAAASDAYQMSEQAHVIEMEISILNEKITAANALIDKNQTEISAIEQRSTSLAEQLASAEREVNDHARQLQAVTGELRQAETAQAEADRKLMEARSSRENRNIRLIELESRISSGKTEEQALREQGAELESLTHALASALDEARQKQSVLTGQRNGQQEELQNLIDGKREQEDKQVALGIRIETLVDKSEELSLEIAGLSASIEACQARRHLLEEMMLHYEGYESGTVAVLERKAEWPGIDGTVAERFVPVKGMEAALEAALGEVSRYVICRDRQSAEAIIAYLRENRKGRIGIVVPDSGTITPAVKRPDLNQVNVVGWLDCFVSTDESLRPLMEAVLARTVVFEAGTSPDEVLARLPYGFQAVATDGVLYSKNVMTGGSDDSFPLFRRREKILEQENEVSQLTGRLDAYREVKNQVVAELGAARADSSALNLTIETLDDEISGAQRAVAETDFALRSLATEFERVERERHSANQKLERIRGRQYDLGLDAGRLHEQKTSLAGSLGGEISQLEEIERFASDALERLSRLQVAEIEWRSKVQQAESRIGHLHELAAELEQTRKIKADEIERAQQDTAVSRQRISALEQQLKDIFVTRDQYMIRQEHLRAAQDSLLSATASIETQAKQLRSERDHLSEQIHGLETRVSVIQSELAAITSRLQDEHSVDVNTVEIVNPNPELGDEQARQQLQQLKEQLRSFGAVNLLALEEYKEANEREKFLGEQLRDLTTAREDLTSTITQINLTAREIFNETMEKVRANFQRLFVELFSGGEADVRLENSDDPLESNIEIIARPRGKKLLSITMMSGGERALTAISLLFSLYLVKPSPFCILDEIDAPLDDANCRRFLRIIRSFSNQTQFITITHNKITMEAADNLYGVTMEQPGVSKLVGVRFGRNGNGNGDDMKAATIDVTDSDDTLPEAIRERLSSEITISPDDPSSSSS
jgi:chromosome segregation protein